MLSSQPPQALWKLGLILKLIFFSLLRRELFSVSLYRLQQWGDPMLYHRAAQGYVIQGGGCIAIGGE